MYSTGASVRGCGRDGARRISYTAIVSASAGVVVMFGYLAGHSADVC